MSDGLITFYFLVESNNPSLVLKNAFAYLLKQKFRPQWLVFEKSREIVQPQDIIVMDTFQGPRFEHFKNLEIRIITPYVIKYLDRDVCARPLKDIPMRCWPLRSQCMRHIRLTASNLNIQLKETLEERVHAMSGWYNRRLDRSTTHLVTDSVTTDKYHVAGQNNIPIMKIEWVDACWHKLQYEYERADEPSILERYRLPILYKLHISVSGATSGERTRIAQTVEDNGGTYTSALYLDKPNSILLLRKREGQKYTVAKEKKIPCLRMEWLEDSIKMKYALPFEDYDIDAEPKPMEQTTIFEMQEPEEPKIRQEQDAVMTMRPESSLKSVGETLQELISKRLTDKSLRDFLEARNIHATGFEESTLLSIKQAVRLLGAFYYTEPKPSVTDLIVGPDISAEEFQQLRDTHSGRMVRIEWLLECLKTGQLCPLFLYRVDTLSQLSTPLVDLFNVMEDDPEEIVKRLRQNMPPKPVAIKQEMQTEQIKTRDNSDIFMSDDDASQISWEPAEEPEPFNIFDSLPQDSAPKNDDNSKTIQQSTKNNSTSSYSEFLDQDDELFAEIGLNQNESRPATFMFSGFEDERKSNLIDSLKSCLKTVIIKQDQLITPEVTHLILSHPAPTEKVLASIAVGIWILKVDYVEDSIKAKQLLQEKEYQWGEDESVLTHPEVQRNRLMLSAVSWRTHIQQTGRKIFEGIHFLFVNGRHIGDRYDSCANILVAGGATVHYLEDSQNQEATFREEVWPKIQYGVMELRADLGPPAGMSMERFLRHLSQLDRSGKLMRYEIITKHILVGPTSSLEQLMNKFPLTYDSILEVCGLGKKT